MGTANEIAAKLAALGLGTVGTNIFPASRMPEGAVDELCVVYETPGVPSTFGFGTPGIHFEEPGIKVRFRGPRPGPGVTTTQSGPRTKAQTAYLGLAAVEVATLVGGGTQSLYHFLRPQRPPYLFAEDESKRQQWDVDFLCEKEPSEATP